MASLELKDPNDWKYIAKLLAIVSVVIFTLVGILLITIGLLGKSQESMTAFHKDHLDSVYSENKDLKIQFDVTQCLAPDILESVQLEVNDSPCDLNFSSDVQKKSGKFEAAIPKSVLENHGNLCRLTFKVKHTISPNSIYPESTDTRNLGIAKE